MLEEALQFAKKAHGGQLRKGTNKPYIVHPIEVSEIVSGMTSDEEIIAASLLHDTIEDCPGVTKEMLARLFGSRVAHIVACESEDKSKSWHERKSYTIDYLKTAPREVQMVALGDKLSNMRDIDRDLPLVGKELWQRFRMKDKNTIGWYYFGILFSLEKDFLKEAAFLEYSQLVHKNFDLTEIVQTKNI